MLVSSYNCTVYDVYLYGYTLYTLYTLYAKNYRLAGMINSRDMLYGLISSEAASRAVVLGGKAAEPRDAAYFFEGTE